MQPDHNSEDWKLPVEQPSQAPYTAAPQEPTKEAAIVTLTPDEPIAGAAPLPAVETIPEDTVTSANLQPVRWQAQEHIQRDKSVIWYICFGIVSLIVMAVAVFLIKSITFNILVPVMIVALLVYVNRPPRVLDYVLSRQGLHVNDMLHPFSEFKGFGVIHDEEEYSILLLPVKRFKPGVSVYFPESAGEEIVDMLGARLPMLDLRLDLVDQIIRRLRI